MQHTQTRWSKSFPTEISSPLLSYTCSFEKGSKKCNKIFSRPCDLRLVFIILLTSSEWCTNMTHRQHQKNHLRLFKCKNCVKAFPTPKDLERHDNSIHNNTVKYFCPYDYCRDSARLNIEEWFAWGFRRKDHWQKHMKMEHSSCTWRVVNDSFGVVYASC